MAVLFILLFLVLGFVGYVAYVIRQKVSFISFSLIFITTPTSICCSIDPKDIRIHNLQDAKKLLQPPPSGQGPHRYLEKRA